MVKRIRKAGPPAGRELSPNEQERDWIAFTLDGREVRAWRDETIWHAARSHGVTVPHGCLSSAPDFRLEGNCRLCVVEVEGYRTLQPSCLMKVSAGLVIRTDSERAVHARRIVMELLLADAAIGPLSECGRVASAMGLTGSRFPPSDTHPPRDESHLGIAVDLSKCIHCMRCVQACREVDQQRDRHGWAQPNHACRLRLRRPDGAVHLRQLRVLRADLSNRRHRLQGTAR